MSPRSQKASKKRRRAPERGGRRPKKQTCEFCEKRDWKIDYKDVASLRKFMSDRAKIRSSRVTGNCPQCQRKIARAIKNAREMALLPYLGR
jgi:small subunit ribosomal protein S18